MEAVSEDSAEIFDDLYVGLRAGGALRKQRRGEELTHEEKEALSRWQRLSTARKAAALGAFAFGRSTSVLLWGAASVVVGLNVWMLQRLIFAG